MKDKLIKLLDSSYSPYSNYQVSAIVVTKDNKEFSGVNVENISYGATICAERNAITTAVTSGYKKGDFKELHLMCKDDLSVPCFMCRQVISELFDTDTLIYSYDKKGNINTYKVNELCPYPFESEDL